MASENHGKNTLDEVIHSSQTGIPSPCPRQAANVGQMKRVLKPNTIVAIRERLLLQILK